MFSIRTFNWPNETQFIQISWKISVGLQYKLEEILLGVEINFNNHSPTYIQDNIQLNVLTPNSMILGRNVSTLNYTADDDSDE